MKHHRSMLLSAISLSALGMGLNPVVAAAQTDTGDEIVVFGEKIVRSVQETTTSVDVVTPEDIDKLNIIDLEDALRRVGNAGFITVGSGRNEQFTLRGVPGQGVTGGSGVQPVSQLYIDGAVVPNQAAGAAISNAWDVQQIEVLRGAQSTVQGRNSLIGSIVVQTVDPTNDFDWDLQARYAEFGTYDVAGAFGGPIIEDQLLFRIAGQYGESEGFVEDTNGNNADPERTALLRGKFLFTPEAIPGFEAKLTAIYTDEIDGSALVDGDNPGARISSQDLLTRTKRELNLYSLNLNYELSPAIDLVSLTTYSQLETEEVADFDGLADLGFEFSPFRNDTRDQTDFQQEFRVLFEKGRFSGLFGALYAERGGDDVSNVLTIVDVVPFDASFFLNDTYLTETEAAGGAAASIPTPDSAPRILTDPLILGPTVSLLGDFNFEPDYETLAFFGEVTFAVTDKFDLTAGLRYEEEEATFAVTQVNTLAEASDIQATTTGIAGLEGAVQTAIETDLTPIIGASSAATVAAAAAPNVAAAYPVETLNVINILTGPNFFDPIDLVDSQTFSNWLPKAAATYQFTDSFGASLSAQRAYRPGGVGINPARARVFSFAPEFSWNYEVAVRYLSDDGRVRFNANAFLIDWEDQQLEVALSGTLQDTEVLNLGESQLYGLEAQLDVEITEQLLFFATLGLNKTEIQEDNRTEEERDGGPSLEGDEFPFAPSVNGTVGFVYDHPSGFNATVDVNYIGQNEPLLPNNLVVNADPLDPSAGTRLSRNNEPAALVNARLGYRFNDQAEVFVYGSNIFDEDFIANAEALGGSVVMRDPRVVGFGIRLSN